jgi:hypothetical protein
VTLCEGLSSDPIGGQSPEQRIRGGKRAVTSGLRLSIQRLPDPRSVGYSGQHRGGAPAGVAQRQRQRSERPSSIRSNRIVGTDTVITIYDSAVRRFLIVVSVAVLVSVVLGYTIALVYVMNMDVVAVQQPPYPETSQVVKDATAELPLGSDYPGWAF